MKRRDFAVRLRVYSGDRMLMGPGRADLLALVRSTGSISEAAREMEMSYRRAWALVTETNAAFPEPLVERTVGGVHGGGARLTPLGEKMLAIYAEAVAASEAAAAPHAARIAKAAAAAAKKKKAPRTS